MSGIKKVIWTEGTLLGPQHFQQNDRYYEHLQFLNVQRSHNFHWGIVSIDIEDEFLPQGQLFINRCQALLQDGRWIDFDEKHDDRLVFQIPEDTSDDLSVYLTLPCNQLVTEISGYPDASHHASGLGQYEMVGDAYDQSREREILVARQNLKLVKNTDDLTGLSYLKIAELIFDSNIRTYKLSKQFYFPALQISACPNLNNWLSLFVLQLQHDCDYLKSFKKLQNNMASHLNSATETDALLHVSLMRVLYQLYAIKQTALVHPYEIYQILSGLIGELKAFANASDLFFPAYQHAKNSEVFKNIQGLYTSLFAKIKPVEKMTVNLSHSNAYGLISEKINPKHLKQNTFCLGIEHQGLNLETLQSLISQIKIAAPSEIDALVHSFTPGIALRLINTHDGQATAQKDIYYFQLDKNSPGWQSIFSEEQLVVFLGPELVHLPIHLIIY